MSETLPASTDVGDWLARRMEQPSGYYRRMGMSSDALALYAIGRGPRPQVPGHPAHFSAINGRGVVWRGDQCGENYPADLSDLDACERTYQMAPDYLKPVMDPVMEEFRRWVIDGIDRHGNPTGRPHPREADNE